MSYVSPSIIDNTIFRMSDERLDMLGRIFEYYELRAQHGWTFAEFVYKYERGIYQEKFSLPERKSVFNTSLNDDVVLRIQEEINRTKRARQSSKGSINFVKYNGRISGLQVAMSIIKKINKNNWGN